jgi:hypothetical protein
MGSALLGMERPFEWKESGRMRARYEGKGRKENVSLKRSIPLIVCSLPRRMTDVEKGEELNAQG